MTEYNPYRIATDTEIAAIPVTTNEGILWGILTENLTASGRIVRMYYDGDDLVYRSTYNPGDTSTLWEVAPAPRSLR